MANRQPEQNLKAEEEWIRLAEKRVGFSITWVSARYDEETDLLYIKVFDAPATRSKGNMKEGLIFNYDKNNNLVSIEIFDLYELFD